jgi:hypothetical protein
MPEFAGAGDSAPGSSGKLIYGSMASHRSIMAFLNRLSADIFETLLRDTTFVLRCSNDPNTPFVVFAADEKGVISPSSFGNRCLSNPYAA